MRIIPTALALVPSRSNPGTEHEVRLGRDGVVYCSCLGWKRQRLAPRLRTCHHTRLVMARLATVASPAADVGR